MLDLPEEFRFLRVFVENPWLTVMLGFYLLYLVGKTKLQQEAVVIRGESLKIDQGAEIVRTLNDYRERLAKVEGLYIDMAATNRQLVVEHHATQDELSDTRAKLTESERKVAYLETKVRGLEAENADLRKQLDELRTKVNG